jgi:hypothetical protein
MYVQIDPIDDGRDARDNARGFSATMDYDTVVQDEHAADILRPNVRCRSRDCIRNFLN